MGLIACSLHHRWRTAARSKLSLASLKCTDSGPQSVPEGSKLGGSSAVGFQHSSHTCNWHAPHQRHQPHMLKRNSFLWISRNTAIHLLLRAVPAGFVHPKSLYSLNFSVHWPLTRLLLLSASFGAKQKLISQGIFPTYCTLLLCLSTKRLL